jgi:hypothetical protein
MKNKILFKNIIINIGLIILEMSLGIALTLFIKWTTTTNFKFPLTFLFIQLFLNFIIFYIICKKYELFEKRFLNLKIIRKVFTIGVLTGIIYE